MMQPYKLTSHILIMFDVYYEYSARCLFVECIEE
jgi:hypothetical protein